MMVSPAFAATMAYDTSGNPFQMAYAAGATLYPAAAAFPLAPSDPRAYEMIPHRIFVGGFPATTTELDLRMFFEKFGHVREAKVIRSNEGTSKGYGFITFDTEEEAKAVMQISTNQDAEKLEFRGRRLNLGPAIRRMIHTPRYAPEYAIATPAGQLLTASAIGGITYAAIPQSPVVMVPPSQLQPFIYSPVTTIAPTQFTLSNTDVAGNNRAQQVTATANAPVVLMPNTGNGVSPHDSPRTNGIGGQPAQIVSGAVHVAGGQPQQHQQQQLQQSYSVNPPVMPHIAPVTQPLTPITPSITTQRAAAAAVFPQGAYYAPAAPANDMTHYSQMTAPTFFFAPGGYQTVDSNGQATPAAAAAPNGAMPITTPNPVTAQIAPPPPTPQTPQQCYYEESVIAGWQNTSEVHPTNTPRRSPMKSVMSLSNQMNQVAPLQSYDRKDCQQSGPANVTASSSKQFP